MAKADIENKLKGFGDRMKAEPVAAVIQEVKPIEPSKKERADVTEQLNVRLPKALKKQLKAFALNADASTQDIVNDALRVYLLKEDRRY